jgi:hypothetical protein
MIPFETPCFRVADHFTMLRSVWLLGCHEKRAEKGAKSATAEEGVSGDIGNHVRVLLTAYIQRRQLTCYLFL